MNEQVSKSQPATVLIAGAGPTGMTAAMELTRMQIPVRLIEKAGQPATTSRAIGVQARTLELFEQRGLATPMLERGNPGRGGSIYVEGKRTFRLDFAHNGSDYGYILFISQAETEAVLRAELGKQGGTIERQVELVALARAEHGDGVKAILRHEDGSLEEFACAYLIDTEGAHSIARSTLDMPFKGKTRHEEYALGDLHIEGDLPSTDLHIFSSAFGFLGLFPMGGDRFRLIASNPGDGAGKDKAPTMEELQTIYDERSQIPARFHDMIWSSTFRINSRMVDHLHAGRVFLGGDAAHIHSPAGGQGMNTGIQDMINLAWKLALVIQGKADARLLDTYSEDRIPVIQGVLSQSERLTDAAGSESEMLRSVLRHIAPWIVGADFVQENITEGMSQVALNYRGSSLSDNHGHSGEIRAGDRIPNLAVTVTGGEGETAREAQSEKLFQILNPDRFTLLFANLTDVAATRRSAEALLAAWKGLLQSYSVTAAAEQAQRFHGVFGAQPLIILVRPDGYAAFTGSDRSLDELVKYLERWFPVHKTEEQNQQTHA